MADSLLNSLLIFTVAQKKFGLDLQNIERVTRAAWITDLPDAPRQIAGAVNVQGKVLPVLDLKLLWGNVAPAPQHTSEALHAIGTDDQFIITCPTPATPRALALWVNHVEGVVQCSADDWIEMADVIERAPGARRFFSGAFKREAEIVWVCDPAALLNAHEEAAFEMQLAQTLDTQTLGAQPQVLEAHFSDAPDAGTDHE